MIPPTQTVSPDTDKTQDFEFDQAICLITRERVPFPTYCVLRRLIRSPVLTIVRLHQSQLSQLQFNAIR